VLQGDVSIFLDRMRKTMKSLTHGLPLARLQSAPVLPEYEFRKLMLY